MLTDEFLFLAIYSLSLLAVQTHITRAQASPHTATHIYKENMYTHTYTVQWPSLCWVGKESGVTACCQPVSERKGESGSKKMQRKSKRCWRNVQNGDPPSLHSIKTNAIRGSPYLSWLMLADRVAAISNAHGIMHFFAPLTDWWCITTRLDGSCRNRQAALQHAKLHLHYAWSFC